MLGLISCPILVVVIIFMDFWRLLWESSGRVLGEFCLQRINELMQLYVHFDFFEIIGISGSRE